MKEQFSALRGVDPRREVSFLLSALGCFFGDEPEPFDEEVNAFVLAELARLNKATLILPSAPLPSSLAQRLAPTIDGVLLRTTAMNLGLLVLSREVTSLLGARGIYPLHLKGPLQQIDLLGAFNSRPAGDVDILVKNRDQATAADLLKEAGFVPKEAQLATWWSWFLGETHFVGTSGRVVDLHHRLSQPGTPPMRNLVAVFDDAREQTWGGCAFLVPSQTDQALIAALGVVKAMVAEEPCGGHLLDVRAALARLDRRGRGDLRLRASHLGLASVLAIAEQALDAAFAEQAGQYWSDRKKPLLGISDADLRVTLIAPWAVGAARLRRRALLWALSNGSSTAFARMVGRVQLSEMYRRGLSRLSLHVAKSRS